MVINSHEINGTKIAEIISEEMLIQSVQDGLDLMGNIYYQGFDKVILYEKNIIPEFFDLKKQKWREKFCKSSPITALI